MAKTIQLLTARCGKIRPDSVADYLAHDGFSALKKAMNMSPMEIINEVIDAKLLGRGGASYPAGKNGNSFMKLRAIQNTSSATRTRVSRAPLRTRSCWKRTR